MEEANEETDEKGNAPGFSLSFSLAPSRGQYQLKERKQERRNIAIFIQNFFFLIIPFKNMLGDITAARVGDHFRSAESWFG